MEIKKINGGHGCLSIIAFLLIMLAGIGFIGTLIRLFFSSLAGVKPIDEETGEYIAMPWKGIGLIVGIAIGLYLIERLYYWLRNRL